MDTLINSGRYFFSISKRNNVKWKPSKTDWFKLNFDGAYKGNFEKAGDGGVIRNNKGVMVGAFT